MNKNKNIISYLSTKRIKTNVFGTSHHACLLVPNHLKGLSAKVGYLWRESL